MGLMMNALRKHGTVFGDLEENEAPLFSAATDVSLYDYMNCEKSDIFGPNNSIQRHLNLGLTPGIHCIIGKSQSGKTSLMIKLAGNIISKFPNSMLYFVDGEKTTSVARMMSLTGLSPDRLQEQVRYTRFNINHDSLYNDIRQICQTKESLKDQLMIDTGFRNTKGKPIKVYSPDVYLLDSISTLTDISDTEEIKTGTRNTNTFEVKEVEVNRKVEGMQGANSNKQLLLKILDLLYRYNIRFVAIGHITKNIAMNAFAGPAKVLPYLKQDEHIAGGNTFLYLCTNITRTDFVSKLDDNEFGPMIHGSRNRLTMSKNKSNLSGVPVPMIFDQKHGYVSSLSSFEYLLQRGYGLDMQARSMNFKVYPNKTFTKKTLYEELLKDFKENGYNSPLNKALIYTIQQCLFHDFCVHNPDPNPNNWTHGSPVPLSYVKGAM